MPTREPVVLAADAYQLRHIGPKDVVWPDCPAAPVTVLARTDMVARPLPLSQLPSSPDLAFGSWTGRLGDAGEMALTFPNKEASDGVPWRSRFDPTGHLQFVEIYYNGELESCCVIDQLTGIDQTQVPIHGSDGWFLLKKAYERDWIAVQAPRDVIERGTGVWVPAAVDNFPAGSLSSQWTSGASFTAPGTASVTIGPSGGLILAIGAGGGLSSASINSAVADTSGPWRAMFDVQNAGDVGTLSSLEVGLLRNGIVEGYTLDLDAGTLTFNAAGLVGTNPFSKPAPSQPSYSFMLESDGTWVSAFANGQLIGCVHRPNQSIDADTSMSVEVTLESGATTSVTISNILFEVWQPFLQRGSDKGDYVLPGDASTYPSGGLHARYFNDLDRQSDSDALQKILAPTRTNAYLGSGGPEYMNQQDPQINGQNPPGFAQTTPGPGAAGLSNWSVVWFGAVYLKLSKGNYTFTYSGGSGLTNAIRIWVGKTQFGDQLFDNWDFSTGITAGNFTVSATTLAGSLPYDGGAVARDGWYPIRVEYAVGASSLNVGAISFTPPVSYTDPGGTALTGGTSVAIPATSFSPLGMVDQRYQGVSHYDLVQQTGQAYGYQLSVEPQQLESGLFPGVLAPRVREGHDTDIILKPDRSVLQDGEGILNYSSGLDATDFAASMQGNGAGFQNGNTGQLQAMVFDAPTMQESLFDVQQWTDFSDASFTSLLQASLNAQLGLQLEPWQLLSADPKGRQRQSFTWPLPGELAAMRWRPGDGLRIQAVDINVFDTAPRQILTFTRNLLPLGTASSNASFALRPKTQARVLKQQLYKATRWARNYQRQLVTLTGNWVNSTLGAGTTDPNFSIVTLLASDQVVRARLSILENSAGQHLNLLLNNTDITTSLNGPWIAIPATIDVTAFAVPDAAGTTVLVAALKNTGGSSTIVQYQMFVDVLR